MSIDPRGKRLKAIRLGLWDDGSHRRSIRHASEQRCDIATWRERFEEFAAMQQLRIEDRLRAAMQRVTGASEQESYHRAQLEMQEYRR